MSDDLDRLDEPVRRALTEARLELSLEFHDGADGRKSGALRIKDAAGRTIAFSLCTGEVPPAAAPH